ncbi:MAG TPA: carboxypeptidase-like regulatory domain-containing protein, partial [Acidobacteriaceae bacterium]|nr:carboxypeptidase-like regulatory domain-containing protein [Acidobacteriaceae bacterium]
MRAQTDTARIQGTVSDATGAVISGAQTTVTNTDTNTIVTAISDDHGNFSLNALPRGNYKAEVKASGFESQAQTFTL